MRRNRSRNSITVCLVFLICFLVSHLPVILNPIFLGSAAEHKEYEVDKFDENITIPSGEIKSIDFELQEGEEFEVVFTLQVKEGLPIDVWFVNEDHYLLLVNGAQFIFYIDGSEQEVIYTRKIVTLTEYDIYKLVMTNYNNYSVEVNVIYEIRTYYSDIGETPSSDLSIFVYSLLIVVIILAALLIVLLMRTRSYRQTKSKVADKASHKSKAKSRKAKKVKPKGSEKISPKKPKIRGPKRTEPEISDKVPAGFCGHCGKPVDTPYCKYCGRKV